MGLGLAIAAANHGVVPGRAVENGFCEIALKARPGNAFFSSIHG
jgi:hypothetical protein